MISSPSPKITAEVCKNNIKMAKNNIDQTTKK